MGGGVLAMLTQRWMFKNAKYKNVGFCWVNITNITPHDPDDGSVEPKRYSVDFSINLTFHSDYLVINFSTYCRITILYLLSFNMYVWREFGIK